MEEIWRPTQDYPNYEVSNTGLVRNLKTNRMMKLNNKGGYQEISLRNNIKRTSFKVHRLVAIAFIDNPLNKSDVNHKDKNKLNNHVDNLEWVTRQENNIHRCKDITITNNRNKNVCRIDINTGEELETYNSIQDAAKWAIENKLSSNEHNARNAIGNAITGLSSTSYGFKWKHITELDVLDGEIWKEISINIVGKPNYWVSNLGRFRNDKGIIMINQKNNENGYVRITIGLKTYLLHRLIALTFIENPENKEQVNHIDGNKLNNKLDNLEWVTNKENQLHKHQIGLGNNFTRRIIQYDLDENKIQEFESIVLASKVLGIGKSNIRGVLVKYRKTAGGFIFKYAD